MSAFAGRGLGVVAAIVVALLAAGVARADGEAGLVIQHGNGAIETYCVPFTGDSITGKQMLQRVNIPVEDYGGLVCAVGVNEAEGCFGASSFDSCTCKCAGGGSCVYWAFFTASHGKAWTYSALGFNQAKARDGDLQAWRWGPGGPNSAPAPPAISFESVCGHAPRGGVSEPTAVPATAAPTLPPSVGPATAQVGTAVASPPAATATSAGTEATTSSAPTTAATTVPSVSVTIVSHGLATATPAAPASGSLDEDGGGSSGLLTFGLVGGGLVAAIVGALVWRRTHGS